MLPLMLKPKIVNYIHNWAKIVYLQHILFGNDCIFMTYNIGQRLYIDDIHCWAKIVYLCYTLLGKDCILITYTIGQRLYIYNIHY